MLDNLTKCRFVSYPLGFAEPLTYNAVIEKVKVTKNTISIKAYVVDGAISTPPTWFTVKPDGGIVTKSKRSWLASGNLLIGAH